MHRTLIDPHELPSLFAHHVAKAAELIELGLTGSTVYARTRPGGPWQKLLPGVLLLSNAPPTRTQLVRAALHYAGEGAVLTGHDALHLHGMRDARRGGPIHVLIPHDRQLRGAESIVVERTTRLPSPRRRGDFPVAPLERAVLDAARRMSSVDGMRAIIAETVRRGGVRPTQLRAELDQGSNRGSAAVRRVLAEISDGVRSVAQAWARRLILRSDLPEPAWNVPVCDATGHLITIVNAWWEDAALAWEIDSAAWSPDSYPATSGRADRLAAEGITVLRTDPDRIRRTPLAVLRQLEQSLAEAQARPRPKVLAG